MRQSLLAASVLCLALTGCGGGGETGPADQAPADTGAIPGGQDTGSGAFATVTGGFVADRRYNGTLYLVSNNPLDASQTLAADFDAGRLSVVINGVGPSTWGGPVAFVEYCSPLAARLSVSDSDGFNTPISECVEQDIILPNLFGAAINPAGDRFSITDLEAPAEIPEGADPLMAWAQGKASYPATQVYDASGNRLAEFPGYGPSTWTRDGRLLLAGRGEQDVAPGIYLVSEDLTSTRRIDDGRITGAIADMDAHPRQDRVAFVFNSQIFEMDLDDGKPSRSHSHGVPIASVAYSPDGSQIAFVSTDPLGEAMNTEGPGYPLFILDGDRVGLVRFADIPGGPLDWVE